LFGVWALTAALFLVRAETRGGWVGLLRIAGGGFALVPVASALGTETHLFNVGLHGRGDVLGVELGLLLLGAGLLLAASIVQRRSQVIRAREDHIGLPPSGTARQQA
jgi:hypothetical protein